MDTTLNTPSIESAKAAPKIRGGRVSAPKRRSHGFHVILLLILTLLVALPGITKLPVIDRDEARYAVASVQMAESGDLINIRFQDEARNKKPAGSYWAQTAMIKIFSEPGARKIWVQRLPSVLAALLTVLACYWAGIAMIGRRGAFIGAGLLAVSGLMIFEAHMAKTDAMLAASAALTLVSFAYLRQGGGRGFALLFWFAMGMAVMIKGPVVPALALLTLLSLWLLEREEIGEDSTPKWTRKLWYWPGPVLFLLMILPWSVLIWQATDGQFFKDALGGDFGGKLIGASEKHGGWPGYYAATLPITFWPASLLLIPGLAFAFRAVRGSKGSNNPVVRGMRLALCFALPYWIVLEFVPTKLPNYLLPIFPALALMAGGAAVTILATKEFIGARLLSAALFIVAGITIITAVLVAESVYGQATNWPYIMGGAGLIAVLASGAAMAFSKTRLALSAGLLSVLIISPLTYQVLLPSLSKLRLADRVVSEMRAHGIKLPREGGPTVLAHNFTEPSLVYHLGTAVRLGDQIKLDSSLTPGTIIISDVAREDSMDFDTAFNAAGLCRERFAKFDGFNYSHGDPVTLEMSEITPCAPTKVLEVEPDESAR